MAQSVASRRGFGSAERDRRVGIALATLALMTSVGCGMNEILHGLDEREANQILVVLESHDIAAEKQIEEGRVITWKVAVSKSVSNEARRILVDAELPQPK